MKHAVAALVLMPLLLVGIGRAQTMPEPQQQQKFVSVAVTAVRVYETRSTRADTLLLWNRNVRDRPIGHAIKTCVKAGVGDILGGGVMNCQLVIWLPLGKIIAGGTVHNLGRYTLVITGGTGVYEGVTGPMFVSRIADGVRRLTFKL